MDSKTETVSDMEAIAELGYKILRSGHVIGIRGKKVATVIKNGYEQVNLTVKRKTKSFLLHRLVALEFIPNPDNKPQVNHIDGIKLNNDWKNLEWCTPSENIKHGIDLGLIPKSMVGRTGHRHWRSRPVERFDRFGESCGTYESTGDAARETGLNVKSIQDACKGRIKMYKGFSWRYKK